MATCSSTLAWKIPWTDPHWTSHNNSLHVFHYKTKTKPFAQHLTQTNRVDVDESEREESRIKAKFLIWATGGTIPWDAKIQDLSRVCLGYFWSGRWKWKSFCAHENFENPVIHPNRGSMKSWYHSRAKYIKISWVIIWFWHLKKRCSSHDCSAARVEIPGADYGVAHMIWNTVGLKAKKVHSILNMWEGRNDTELRSRKLDF